MSGCETARRLMDERLDGEIGATEAIDLEVHLRGCLSCREIASGLEGVVSGLGRMPLEIMPDADVEAVLARTIGSRRDRRDIMPRRWVLPAPYVIAAAAVLAAVAIVPFALRPSAPPEPTVAQVEEAAQEARMVLALASRAVRSAESTARDRVIGREVAPALKHVPVRWNQVPSSRRSGV